MFRSARIKLTSWYLLIIMFISISFSATIYKVLTSELDRVERMQRLRVERRLLELFPPDLDNSQFHPPILDPELMNEAKNRLKITLGVINLTILGASAVAGYFLAGRTLKPIHVMLEEQKRFVADASHELRTPLTSLKTETEVALRNKKLDSTSVKKLLTSNLEEIDKLKSLTDYFLELDNYKNSNAKFTFETFNLAEIIEKACSKLQSLAKEKNIEVARNLKNVSIEANKISIAELITILLDNAIKYSHQESKINISTKIKRNKVWITVEDLGIGIKASDIPFIFAVF